VALLRLGESEVVWPQLGHSPDPRLRSFIINWLEPLGADPGVITDAFDRRNPPARGVPGPAPESLEAILFDRELAEWRAVILAMGTYPLESFSAGEREPRIARLLEVYQADPDAGVHGAAEWTLRRWGQAHRIAATDARLQGVNRDGRRWLVNSQGQTFVVVAGHFEFAMGSPPDEPGHRPQELLHHRVLHRRFVLANKEVSVAQYRKYLEQSHQAGPLVNDGQPPDEDGPMIMITWYEAAEYCNWLSRQEGLTEVYLPNPEGKYAAGMTIKADALKLNGYRLPTESEWEYTCRAGTRTSRYYGNSPKILGNYAWSNANSGDRARPCASLLPNDLGMFDMLGNTYEWCQGRADDYEPDQTNTLVDELRGPEVIPGDKSRVLRGGSFFDRPEDSRSAYRDREGPGNRYMTYGFRPARTMP
jgi:formylglycine-generating enzyme required for sulfatase activity